MNQQSINLPSEAGNYVFSSHISRLVTVVYNQHLPFLLEHSSVTYTEILKHNELQTGRQLNLGSILSTNVSFLTRP
jgi:hypothetical protein